MVVLSDETVKAPSSDAPPTAVRGEFGSSGPRAGCSVSNPPTAVGQFVELLSEYSWFALLCAYAVGICVLNMLLRNGGS